MKKLLVVVLFTFAVVLTGCGTKKSVCLNEEGLMINSLTYTEINDDVADKLAEKYGYESYNTYEVTEKTTEDGNHYFVIYYYGNH